LNCVFFFRSIIKVKVDAKTKALLDEYKKKKRHELAKKAANDTTAFRFVYEEEDDENKSNSTDPDGKVKEIKFRNYFFFILYFKEKIR
jgi:hypothetical protein